MGCPNGSEPKPGVTGYVWIDAGNPDDTQQRPWWYGFGLLPRWAENVNQLCAQDPPIVDPFNLPDQFGLVGDILTWIANNIANFTNYARAKAWHRYCRCKSTNPDGTLIRTGCSYIEFTNLQNVQGHSYECGAWATVPGTFGMEFTKNGVRTGIEVISANVIQNVALNSRTPNPGFETRYGTDCVGCPEENVVIIPDLPVPPEIPKPPELPPPPDLVPCDYILGCVTDEFIKSIIDCEYINDCVEVEEMEWEEAEVDIVECSPQGYQPIKANIQVIKNANGSLKGAFQRLFNQIAYQAIYQNCPPTNNNYNDFVVDSIAQTDIELPDGCYRIEIDAINIPVGKGRRFGSDGGNQLADLLQLGFYSLQRDGYNTATVPLQFAKQFVAVPLAEQYTRIRIYCDPGVSVRVRMYYRGNYEV